MYLQQDALNIVVHECVWLKQTTLQELHATSPGPTKSQSAPSLKRRMPPGLLARGCPWATESSKSPPEVFLCKDKLDKPHGLS